MNPTKPTIKLKDLPVENPDYSPGLTRFSFAVSCILLILVQLDWI